MTTRLATLPLAFALAAAVAALAGSCAGADTEPANPEEVEERGEREDYEDAWDEGEGQGWQWEGRRQECFYVYDNECFAYFDEACEAAGCGEEVCERDDAAPAQVSCPEE